MAPTEPKVDPAELQEELDQALAQLPWRLRDAVILRYLEGRDQEEAAAVAGCSRSTVVQRSSDGLDQLRATLTRRGTLLSAAVLSTFLAQEASASTPATIAATLQLWNMAAVTETGRAALVAQNLLNDIFWTRVRAIALTLVALFAAVGVSASAVIMGKSGQGPGSSASGPTESGAVCASLDGRRPFPDDNPWNTDVSQEPVDPNSEALLASIGLDKPLRPDFGQMQQGVPSGIPYVVVGRGQPKVPVRFISYPAESDAGPYPIPDNPPIEAGMKWLEGGNRMIVVDRDDWKLYELLGTSKDERGWRASCGAVFDLSSNRVRPRGWTSADGAGLPIFPGLIRYDEVVEQKAIRHALRFCVRRTRNEFVYPARHAASQLSDASLPPMGMRVRLKADFDVSGFAPSIQVILKALQQYGMFVASHGDDWALSGTADSRWNEAELRTLQRVHGRDFEVVRIPKEDRTNRP